MTMKAPAFIPVVAASVCLCAPPSGPAQRPMMLPPSVVLKIQTDQLSPEGER